MIQSMRIKNERIKKCRNEKTKKVEFIRKTEKTK